jgi:hypothetical protein
MSTNPNFRAIVDAILTDPRLPRLLEGQSSHSPGSGPTSATTSIVTDVSTSRPTDFGTPTNRVFHQTPRDEFSSLFRRGASFSQRVSI